MIEIYKQAVKQGVCKEWAEKIKTATIEELSKMFFLGSDWALKNNFPSVELLEKYNAEQYGLIYNGTGLYSMEKLAFFGNSNANIVYSGFDVADVYLRHNSKVEICASGNAIVYVTICDDAEIDVNKKDESTVFVTRYSGIIKGTVTQIKEYGYGKL